MTVFYLKTGCVNKDRGRVKLSLCGGVSTPPCVKALLNISNSLSSLLFFTTFANEILDVTVVRHDVIILKNG